MVKEKLIEDDIYLIDLRELGGFRYAVVAVRANGEEHALKILEDLQKHPERYENAMREFLDPENAYPLAYFRQNGKKPRITKLPYGQEVILAVIGTGED